MSFSGDLYPEAGATSVMTTKGDVVRYDSQRERYGIGSTNQVLTVVAGLPAWADAGHVTQSRALEIACSDETTALTTGTAKVTFRMPFAMTLNQGEDGLRASLTGAGSTSGTTTVDVNQNGSTIMSSTKLTVDYGDLTSVGATAEPVITTLALTDNASITVDVDAVTGGANETGLKIQLIGTLA
tara:strand:- start:86 stop:637 length:552 start_codon:yes stop_codon:yes gene_type:complete